MLNFIKVTSEIINEKLPMIKFSSITYRCDEGNMIINVQFYNSKMVKKAFQFMYYDTPNSLMYGANLAYEFSSYINDKVIPNLD